MRQACVGEMPRAFCWPALRPGARVSFRERGIARKARVGFSFSTSDRIP